MVCTTRHGQGKRWRAWWVDHDGKQVAAHFHTRAECDNKIKDVIERLGAGTYTDPRKSAVTFRVIAEAWIRAKAANRAPKTVAEYEGILERAILPKWGDYPLRDIDHERLQDWITWLSTDPAARTHPKRDEDGEVIPTGLAPASVIHVHRVVSQVFSYAIRSKYIAVNPADHIELPRKPESRDLALSHEQVRVLADETRKAESAVRHRAGMLPPKTSPDGLATMVLTLAYAALRFSECAALRVSDVDIEKRRIMIKRSVTSVRGKGRIERDTTKTHQRQPVPILTRQLADGLALVVEGRDPDQYLFPGPDGKAMSEGWFRVRFDKAVAKLGVPGVVPNTLRHTGGSLAISETPSATGVLLASKLLRHRNVSTTANVYSHLIDGDWEKLAAAMDRATTR